MLSKLPRMALLFAAALLLEIPLAAQVHNAVAQGTQYPLAQLKLTIDNDNVISVLEVNTTHGRLRAQKPILGRRLQYELRDEAGNVLLSGQRPDPRFSLKDPNYTRPVPFILSVPHLKEASHLVIYLEGYEHTGEEDYSRQLVLLEEIKMPRQVAVVSAGL